MLVFKHIILTAVIITLTFSLLRAQQLLDVRMEHPPLNLGITDVCELNDGGFLFTGCASPSTFDSTKALLFKTDDQLQVQWSKRYKVLSRDDFSSITKLADGNMLIGGTARSPFGLIVGAEIFKVDLNGNVLWHKVYSASVDDRILKIFEMPDQSLMIFIRKNVTNAATKMVHASSNGDIINQMEFEFDNRGIHADRVVRTNNNTFILSGDALNTNTSNRDLFLAEVNTTSMLWYRRYDFNETITSLGLLIDGNGDIICNGNIFNNGNPNQQNNWIIRLNGSGNFLSGSVFDIANENQFVGGFIQNTQDHFISTGRSLSNNNKGLVLVHDVNFNLLQAEVHNEELFQTLGGAFKLSNNRVMVLGGFPDGLHVIIARDDGYFPCSGDAISASATTLTPTTITETPVLVNPGIVVETLPYTITDETVISTELCDVFVGVEDNTASPSITVVPNPFIDQLTISGESVFSSILLEITDVYGHLVFNDVTHPGLNELYVNGLGDLEAGMYWLTLNQNGKQTTIPIVKLKQ